MALKILSRNSLNVTMKCTLQANGRLCFTTDTLRELGLKKDQAVKFFEDDEGEMYLLFERKVNKDNFPLTGAGRYLNLNSALFFDSRGIDYVENSIVYELLPQEDETLKKTIYKMVPTVTPRTDEEIERIQKNAIKRKFTRRPKK